jgi:hypothetical protein
MSQNILELWEQPRDVALPGDWREVAKQRVFGTFRERLQVFKQAAERRIDDWIGALDDSQTRPDRDF